MSKRKDQLMAAVEKATQKQHNAEQEKKRYTDPVTDPSTILHHLLPADSTHIIQINIDGETGKVKHCQIDRGAAFESKAAIQQ